MRKIQFLHLLCACFFSSLYASSDMPSPKLIPHEQIKEFSHAGNSIRGLATSLLGAQQFEVWRTSLAIGSATPKHSHETEEIFIFLKGRGKAIVGKEELIFESPCTLILPAGIEHQLFNLGDEPTDAIVILGIHSHIYDQAGHEMILPWRQE